MIESSRILRTSPTNEYRPEEILSYLFDNGSIDMDDVESAMKQIETDRIIKDKHNYAIFQDKDGRYKTYVRDESKKSGRRLIAKSTLEKLNTALVEYYRDDNDDSFEDRSFSTLSDLLNEWLLFMDGEGATATYMLKIKRHWVRYYLGSGIENVPIKYLTRKALRDWAIKTIDEFDLTRKEYTNLTVIVRGILDYAVEEKIIDENIFRTIKFKDKKFRKVKKEKDSKRVFTYEEMVRIEEMAWKEINDISGLTYGRQSLIPLAVLFQFQTGVRVSELAALRYEDLIQDGKALLIQRMYRFASQEIDEYTKGSYGDRIIPLTDEAIRIIETVMRLKSESGILNEGYLFSVKETPPCYNVFYKKYMKYCEHLDTDSKATHTARRNFVSALLSNNVNVNTVREYCGHVDEKTTLNNYCYDMNTEEQKVEQVNNALTWSA